MKKIIYCLLLSISGICSKAQINSITQAEYFWDTDPGEGNAMALMAADGNFDNALESVLQNTATVPATPGLHTFNIRLKDNIGVWGPVFKNIVNTGNAVTTAYTTLSQGEYFWDTDPGEGNGTALVAADGNFDSALENVLQNTASIPATPGLHIFSIRLKDNTGIWGPIFSNVVHTGNPTTVNYTTLTQAEYFWDTDPGEGSGIPLAAADGTFDGIIENILQTGIPLVNPLGLHKFYVRVKDNQGVWGPVFINVIYNENVLSVNSNAVANNYYFYPNPGTTIIRFNRDIEKVDIIDINGRCIGTSTDTEINISDLATGTYILKVTTPEGIIFNKKMIKR